MYKVYGNHEISHLADIANSSPRLRGTSNFHNSPCAPAQHFVNFIKQGSVIPFHNHKSSNVSETLICLSGFGLFGAIVNNELRVELMAPLHMSPSLDAKFCIQVDPKTVHSFMCITNEVILLEVKDGPFCSDQAKDLVEVSDNILASFKLIATDYKEQLMSSGS